MSEPALFGREDLANDLRALGLAPGGGVFVHAAMGRIGRVVGGARSVIEALLAVVGPHGLIGMPGFSDDAYDPTDGTNLPPDRRRAIRAQMPGFDPHLSSVAAMGAVAECFRTWPGVVRSPHPTSSVLLLGRDAETLARSHDAAGWATGPQTPWGRLARRRAMKILLIGVGWNRASALHAAESIAPHRRLKIRHFKTGPAPDAPWIEAPDVADDLDRLFPPCGADFERTGAVWRGLIGAAQSRLCSYPALLDFASDWIDRRNAADGVPPYSSTSSQ